MLIDYARVSTDDRNLDLQRDALHGAGCAKIYEDRKSGAKADRPGLTLALVVTDTTGLARYRDQLRFLVGLKAGYPAVSQGWMGRPREMPVQLRAQ